MVKTETISLESRGTDEIFDVTGMVGEAVRSSGMTSGIVTIFVPGSTGAVTTIEFEPGVVGDLRDALERAAPKGIPYAHDAAWGDGNGYSHVRAAWVGPSLTVPFQGGKPILGTWQQVVVLDCDNKPRDRRVVLQIMGE
jgi:secondary thiamine-phosphate synthase enzyme